MNCVSGGHHHHHDGVAYLFRTSPDQFEIKGFFANAHMNLLRRTAHGAKLARSLALP